jgi:hypothetical protein
MPRVPTSIKVVSILGIILAGLMLLMMPCSVFLQFRPLTPNPMLDALNDSTTYVVYYLASVFISLIMFLLLLAGSIASLKLKPFGRKAMLAYAWMQIAVVVVNTILSFVVMLPIMEEAVASDPRTAAMASLVKVSAIAGAIFSLVFYGGISAVILYFFNRKIAVDAFNGIFPPDPTNFPVVFPDSPVGNEPPQ